MLTFMIFGYLRRKWGLRRAK